MMEGMEVDLKKIMEEKKTVFFTGIKGTGMCAFAELMLAGGAEVLGSDRDEVFYTDAILDGLGVQYFRSFDGGHLRDDVALLVYSAAYDEKSNPEIAGALSRGIPLLKYPQALGLYSRLFDSSGIAGVHGKTTTAAMAGSLVRALSLPAQVLAGSAVAGFGGRSTVTVGNKYFIAETCEYRRHFLFYRPRRIVLTSVQWDHQDYYPDYDSIREAFLEYCRLLPPGGRLIYCADDPGALEAARVMEEEGRRLVLIPYGFSAAGEFRIESYAVRNGRAEMKIGGFPGTILLRLPGRHMALDAAGALALVSALVKDEYGEDGWTEGMREGARRALLEFGGSKRREEVIGEAGGILFMDDYAHHPAAIAATLRGLREFYPGRRIVASFMSHTYSRTAALLDEFAASFKDADVVFLHKIYGSARESGLEGAKVSGRSLFRKTSALRDGVFYEEEPLQAAGILKDLLGEGDLFITMGAGNNWVLGRELYGYFGGNS
jgi:UDP-N-acetylmuramate--alanine ligase